MLRSYLLSPLRLKTTFFPTILSLFFVLCVVCTQANAQPANLVDGSAVVTAFGGFKTEPSGERALDPEGITLKAFDLSRPGKQPDGTLIDVDELLAISAAQIGQVFGLAIDGEDQPTVFIAATSMYGLYRTPDNSDWDPAMWGTNGGPGTIYRLHPDNGYQPEAFAEVSIAGIENSGASLGDLAFDVRSRTLFVSDLENGLVHRMNPETGGILETYDHGIDGRSYFFDTDSETYEVLDIAPWNEQGAAIDTCGAGPDEQAAQRFMGDPSCWGYSGFLRRVFALAVEQDEINGTTRLYYSVWGSTSFADATWDPGDLDALNSIWSIGLDDTGAFNLGDIRREFVMPSFYTTRQDREDYGYSQPVASIEFTPDGAMILAERGVPLGANPADPSQPIIAPASGRVMRYVRDEQGKWVNDSRYDVGFSERELLDAPHLRTAGAGGAALGFGYTDAGRIDPDTWGSTLWMTGNVLCGPGHPCGDAEVDGVQGTPTAATTETAPTDAYLPYTPPGPVTPPDGPNASYFFAFNDTDLRPGSMGDIAIARTIGEAPPPPDDYVDLALIKTADQRVCDPGGLCYFSIKIKNVSGLTYEGTLWVGDDVIPDFDLEDYGPPLWTCVSSGTRHQCYTPVVTLAPGESIDLNLTFRVDPAITQRRVNNCAVITWPGLEGRDQVRAVQIALTDRGFDAGPADGLMGPQTSGAISDAEAAFGLPVTGTITPELLEILFGPGGGPLPDQNGLNDRDCARVDIDIPPPPAHDLQLSAFHRKFRSDAHDPRTTGPVTVHEPALSIFHLRFRSVFHDGISTRGIPIHRRPLSIFHRTHTSDRHDPHTTGNIPVHRPVISTFHNLFLSILHNPVTSNARPTHPPALSRFHLTWRSNRHDGIITRNVPVHRPVISIFHRNNVSRWHLLATSQHRTGLSQFHGRFNSAQHQTATSNPGPSHQPIISIFHRNGVSRFHLRTTSLHRTGLSQFHRNIASNLHVIGTSNQGPNHIPAISTFHQNHGSRFHLLRNSQHRTNLSVFHRNVGSSLHLRGTSNQGPNHIPAISTFHQNNASRFHLLRNSQHRTNLSAFHRTLNSNLHIQGRSNQGPAHIQVISNFHQNAGSQFHLRTNSQHRTGLSVFHNRVGSNLHVQGTSNQGPAHAQAISNFHRNSVSRFHLLTNSQHRTGLSAFHNRLASNLHVRGTSNQGPTHAQAISNFHRNAGSQLHLRSNSQHRTGLSTFHSRLGSNLHVQGTSNQGPTHSAVISTFHQNGQSQFHQRTNSQHRTGLSSFHSRLGSNLHIRGSSNQAPQHNRARSQAVPQHNAVLSTTQNQPQHNRVRSATQNPQPQPQHNAILSATQNQPQHNRVRSATQNPQPQPQPQHTRARSQAAQPQQPQHNRVRSATQNVQPQPQHNRARSLAAQPQQPQQPQHNRVRSATQNVQPQPQHNRARSLAAQPQQPQQPQHNRARSAAQNVQPQPQVQPQQPQQPQHRRRNSRAQQQQQQQQPAQPQNTHTTAKSQAAQQRQNQVNPQNQLRLQPGRSFSPPVEGSR